MSTRFPIAARYFGYISLIGLVLSAIIAFYYQWLLGILLVLEILFISMMELNKLLNKILCAGLARLFAERLQIDQGWIRGVVFCCFSVVAFGIPNGVCIVVGFFMIIAGLLYAFSYFFGFPLDDARLDVGSEDHQPQASSSSSGMIRM